MLAFGSVFKVRVSSTKWSRWTSASTASAALAGWQASYVLLESNGDIWLLAVSDSWEPYRRTPPTRAGQALSPVPRDARADPQWHDHRKSVRR